MTTKRTPSSTSEVALGAAEAEDGLGFVFTEDDPFVGVDLDDYREVGELTEWAEAIVDRLDSYTEVSPSGTDVHVLIEGMIPSTKSRSGSVQCYDSRRFFTMTGDHLPGTPTSLSDAELVETSTSASKTYSMMGRFAAGSIGFGRFRVSGRSRSPSPAARTTAAVILIGGEHLPTVIYLLVDAN